MSDIELVIKIPEEKYQGIINISEEILDASTFCSPRYLYQAVLDGTPLPKGHGDLVDYEELKNNALECSAYTEATLSHIKPKIIIEADNAESEEV